MKMSKLLKILAEQPVQQAGFGGAPGAQATAEPQAPSPAPQAPAPEAPAPPPPKPTKKAKSADIFSAEEIKKIRQIATKAIEDYMKKQVDRVL